MSLRGFLIVDVMQWAVAVLRNDKTISSVLAAPTHCIALNLWADVTGRDNSGVMQIKKPKSAQRGNQKRAANLGMMR